MEATIDVSGLCKAYNGIPAIQDVSFTICRGEVFGLLGANGAGKSTTLECILGTKTANSGTAAILGMNPKKDRKRLFERVGIQFQETVCQDRITVKELCEETACLYHQGRDYQELLAQFGLQEKLAKPVSELSGGQKQRLFIVLALLPDPEVVFLDELTTGLDPKARRDVWKSLGRLKGQGLTVLLTSHYMDEVEALCDRIAILKKGRIVFLGTVDDAKQASGMQTLEDAYLLYAEEETSDEHL